MIDNVAADLEDAGPLREMISTLEPPADLGEAVQDIVRALMLVADVTRPRRAPPAKPRAARSLSRVAQRSGRPTRR